MIDAKNERSDSAARVPIGRIGAWIALLVGEGLLLGVEFDSTALDRLPSGWWSAIVALAGRAMPAAACFFAALVLAVARVLRRDSRSIAWRETRAAIPFAAAHVAAFAALLVASSRLFDATRELHDPGLEFALWLGAIALVLASWIAALATPSSIAASVRSNAALLLAALAIGAIAFAVGALAEGLWLPLRRATFAVASDLLHSIVPSATSNAEKLVLGAREFKVRIAPACSGYEGVGLAVIFVTAALWLFRAEFRFPRAFALIAIGVAAAWLANVARLVALILVGAFGSPAIAMGGFHSYAGTILFSATSLATIALGLRSPWFQSERSRAGRSAQATYVAAAYLIPLLAMVAASLLSRAFSDGASEPLAFLRPLAAVVALAFGLREYRRLERSLSMLAFGVGFAVAGMWWALVALGEASTALGAPSSTFEIALAILTTVVLTPIVEELAFRGFLARRIASAEFESVDPRELGWLAIALSSLAFGVLHRHVIAGVAAGACYGWLYRRRGSIVDAIVAHAVTNAALVAIGFATGANELWM